MCVQTPPQPRCPGKPGHRYQGKGNSRADLAGGLRGTRGLLCPAGIPAQPRPADGERPGRDTAARDEAEPAPPRPERALPGLPSSTARTPTCSERGGPTPHSGAPRELPEPCPATPPRPQVVQSPARKFPRGLCLAAGGAPAGSSGGDRRRSRGVPQVSPQVPPQVPPAPLSRCPGSAPRARGNMAA